MQFVYFDSETYLKTEKLPLESKEDKDNCKVVPYLIGVSHNGNYQVFYQADDFVNWLCELSNSDRVQVYGYNVLYDICVIFPLYLEKKPNTFTKFDLQIDGNYKFLSCVIKTKTGKLIEFVDLWRWNMGLSLNKWLKTLGKPPKPNFNYEKFNLCITGNSVQYMDRDGNLRHSALSNELSYLRNDVIWLRDIHFQISKDKKIAQQLTNTNVKGRTLTCSSFSKKLLKDWLRTNYNIDLDEMFRPQVSLNEYNLLLNSYYGGLVFANSDKYYWKLENCTNFKSYDVNSMYPFQLSKPCPYGLMLKEKPKKPHLTFYEVKATGISWKTNFNFTDPPLPAYIFAKKQSFLLISDLFEILKKCCEFKDLQVIRVVYWLTTDLLIKYVTHLYELKLKSETQTKKANAKLMLNGLYGKFGEQFHDYSYVYDVVKLIWEEVINEEEAYLSIIVGVYIVQSARAYLLNTIVTEVENGNTVIYVDTDSIKLICNKPVKFKVDDNELGAWKHEFNISEFYYGGKRKRYFLITDKGESKFTTGGFSGEVLKGLKKEEIIKFYDADTDVIIKGGDVYHYFNKYGQIVILHGDFHTNQGASHEWIYQQKTQI